MTDNRKVISRRPMRGLKAKRNPIWHDMTAGAHISLSEILDMACFTDRVYLCGSLTQMSREYVEEPLGKGWFFQAPYVHKHRAPVYGKMFGEEWRTVRVKLISHREGWFPDCEDASVAVDAWRAFESEWSSETDIPLLSTPSKT